jgi:hypothetical protein
LGKEGDYLIRTCGDKDFAERVQTESEQRPSAAAMFFDGNGMQTRPGDAGFHRQRYGKRAKSASNVHSLSGLVRCVASSAKPLVLRFPNMVSIVQRWR